METVLLFVLIPIVKLMVAPIIILSVLLVKMDLCLSMEPASPVMSINVSSAVLLVSAFCALIISRLQMGLALSVRLLSVKNVIRMDSV